MSGKSNTRKPRSRSKPPTPRSDGDDSPSLQRARVNSAGTTEVDGVKERKITLSKPPSHKSGGEGGHNMGEQSTIQVAVRVRPMSKREETRNMTNIVSTTGNTIEICNPRDGTCKSFTFDRSYPMETEQTVVYDDIGDSVVQNAYEGYNCCILAYGQTGSGKTHTMMGDDGDEMEEGLIPRIAKALLAMAVRKKEGDGERWEYHFEVSYMEIYAEKVYDLLGTGTVHSDALRIRYHPRTGPYVEGLRKLAVQTYDDMRKFIDKGNKRRTVAATEMNSRSSRSHAIFTISFKQLFYAGSGDARQKVREKVSTVYLVDLAGSERVEVSGVSGVNLQEAIAINQSLVTLGLVITKLVKNQKAGVDDHIPVRDSSLTWILSDAIGGNSKTFMVATVSPADANYNESLNTLRYADNAKKIINKVSVNEQTDNDLVLALQSEIASLREQLAGRVADIPGSASSQALGDEIALRESIINDLTKTWEQQLSETKQLNSGLLIDLEIEQNAVQQLREEKESLTNELLRVLAEKDKEMATMRDQARGEIELMVVKQIDSLREGYQDKLKESDKALVDLRRKLGRAEDDLSRERRSLETLQSQYNELLQSTSSQSEDLSTALARKTTLERKLNTYIEEVDTLHVQLEEATASIEKYKQSFNASQQEMVAFRNLYNEAIGRVGDMELLSSTIDKLRNTNTVLESKLRDASAGIMEQTAIIDTIKDEHIKAIAAMESSYAKQTLAIVQNYEAQIGELKSQTAMADEELNCLVSELTTAKAQIDVGDQTIVEIVAARDTAIEKSRELSLEILSLKTSETLHVSELKGEIEELTTSLTHAREMKTESDNNFNEAIASYTSVSDELTQVKQQMANMSHDLTTAIDKERTRGDVANASLSVATGEISALKTILETRTEELEKCRQDIEILRQAGNKDSIIHALNEQIDIKTKEIAYLNKQNEELIAIRDKYTSLTGKFMGQSSQIGDLEQTISNLQARMTRLLQPKMGVGSGVGLDVDVVAVTGAGTGVGDNADDIIMQVNAMETKLLALQSENIALQQSLGTATQECTDLRGIIDKIKADYGNVFLELQKKDSVLTDKEREMLGQREQLMSLSKSRMKQLQALAKLHLSLKQIQKQVAGDPETSQ